MSAERSRAATYAAASPWMREKDKASIRVPFTDSCLGGWMLIRIVRSPQSHQAFERRQVPWARRHPERNRLISFLDFLFLFQWPIVRPTPFFPAIRQVLSPRRPSARLSPYGLRFFAGSAAAGRLSSSPRATS